MSWYNHPIYDLYGAFFVFVVAPLFVLVYLILRLAYGKERTEEMIDSWLDDGLTNTSEVAEK